MTSTIVISPHLSPHLHIPGSNISNIIQKRPKIAKPICQHFLIIFPKLYQIIPNPTKSYKVIIFLMVFYIWCSKYCCCGNAGHQATPSHIGIMACTLLRTHARNVNASAIEIDLPVELSPSTSNLLICFSYDFLCFSYDFIWILYDFIWFIWFYIVFIWF